jgi:hypothetical protein
MCQYYNTSWTRCENCWYKLLGKISIEEDVGEKTTRRVPIFPLRCVVSGTSSPFGVSPFAILFVWKADGVDMVFFKWDKEGIGVGESFGLLVFFRDVTLA